MMTNAYHTHPFNGASDATIASRREDGTFEVSVSYLDADFEVVTILASQPDEAAARKEARSVAEAIKRIMGGDSLPRLFRLYDAADHDRRARVQASIEKWVDGRPHKVVRLGQVTEV